VAIARPLYLISRTFNDVPTALRRTHWDEELSRKRGEIMSGEIAAKVARWLAIAQLLEAEARMVGMQFASKRAHAQHTYCSASRSRAPPRSQRARLVFSKMMGVAEGRYTYVRDAKTKMKKVYSIFAIVGKDIDDLLQVNEDDSEAPIEETLNDIEELDRRIGMDNEKS
jgi:hypothetical protein